MRRRKMWVGGNKGGGIVVVCTSHKNKGTSQDADTQETGGERMCAVVRDKRVWQRKLQVSKARNGYTMKKSRPG